MDSREKTSVHIKVGHAEKSITQGIERMDDPLYCVGI